MREQLGKEPPWTHRGLGTLTRAAWKRTLAIFPAGIPARMIYVQGLTAAGLGMSKGWKGYKMSINGGWLNNSTST